MTFSKISEENGVLEYSFDHVDHSEKYGYIGQIRFTREDEFGNAILDALEVFFFFFNY